jgi:hypothetical protein
MDYSLFSSTGNMIDWFESEPDARAALERIVVLEPECADDVALFVCDDDGAVVEGPFGQTRVETAGAGSERRVLGARRTPTSLSGATGRGFDQLGDE